MKFHLDTIRNKKSVVCRVKKFTYEKKKKTLQRVKFKALSKEKKNMYNMLNSTTLSTHYDEIYATQTK